MVEKVVGPASSDEDGFVEDEEEEEVKEEEEDDDDEKEEHNHKQDSLGPSRKKQKTSKFGMDMEELHKVFEEWQRQREANTESIMEAKPAAHPNPKPHPLPPKRDQSKPKFLPKSSIKPSPVARMPGQSSEEEEWGAEEGEDGSPGEEDEESEFADAGYVLDKSGQLVDSQSEDGNQAGQLVDSQSEDEKQASSSDEEIAPSAGAAGRAQRASHREERKKHGGEESTEASKKETKQRAPGAKAKTKKARSSKKNSTEVAKYLNAVSAPPGTPMSALTMDSGVKYQSPSKHGWAINFENDNTSVGKVKKSSRESPTKGVISRVISLTSPLPRHPQWWIFVLKLMTPLKPLKYSTWSLPGGETSFLVRNPLRGGRGGWLQNVDVWLRWTDGQLHHRTALN